MTGERRLVILVNDRIRMSRGKYAAQAVHAALLALGVHPECPVIVLGGSPAEISKLKTTVFDAGLTEVSPNTLTAGTDWEEDSENSDRERRAAFRWRIPVFGRRSGKA